QWPAEANNGGYSLVPVYIDDLSTPKSVYYWRKSTEVGGNPGRDDQGSAEPIRPKLLLTEIMYHPPDEGAVDGDWLEFVEYKNAGNTPIDMSGWYFLEGVTYTFPNGTILQPGAFLVIAADT